MIGLTRGPQHGAEMMPWLEAGVDGFKVAQTGPFNVYQTMFRRGEPPCLAWKYYKGTSWRNRWHIS